MTGYDLTKAMSLTEERFWAEAESRRGIVPLRRILAVAAVLAVVCVGAWGVYAHSDLNEPMLITGEDVEVYIAACYASPPPDGTVRYEAFVYSTVEQYADQNAAFWLSLEVFDNTGSIRFSKDKAYAEAERLTKAGYDIYIVDKDWIGYWGEEKHSTAILGIFTKEQLDSFAAREDYGYMFGWAEGITPDECVSFGK